MEFLFASPDIFSHNVMFMLEAMTFKVSIRLSKLSEQQRRTLSVQVWTNIYHRQNPEGVWHGITLECVHQDKENNQHLFENSVTLTSSGNFRFTYKFCWDVDTSNSRSDKTTMWRGGFGEDGTIEVRPPSNDRWTQGPHFDHIIGSVYLGNFIAASMADKLDFTAVLNVADNLDIAINKFENPILYKKVPMVDGAGNQINSQKLVEAVTWLKQQDVPEKRILVNCRAGIGRAGSTVVAYVFACNNQMSFQEAYDFVYSKRFVYPHCGLKEQLYQMFPRSQ